MPNNSDVLLKKPRMDYYFSNKIRCNYDMYESMKLDNFKIPISIGQIIPHHYNKNRGIKLYFCDKGCIIPNYSGLDHCPQGHTGFHSIFYPTYALLKSGPNKDINIKNYFNLKDGYVRFIGKPEIGMELKYDMRRISLNIKDKNNISGLLNWAPTYMPTNKVLFR